MITRNLQTVSKSASTSHKCALLHAHKRNIIISNHSLPSNSVFTASTSLNHSTNACINASIGHNTKHCFSTTQQQSTPITSSASVIEHDIIPAHIQLSDEQRKCVMDILKDLQNNGHQHVVQLIREQFKRSSRKRFVPSSIKALDVSSYDQCENISFLVLSYIESTPEKSLALVTQPKLMKKVTKGTNETIEQFKNSCEQSLGQQEIYHCWLSSTSNYNTATKLTKGCKPKTGTLQYQFYQQSNIKPKSILIATISKNDSINVKMFKDIMTYALSLDSTHAGFDTLPKWAKSIETQSEKPQSTDKSSSADKLVAKDIKEPQKEANVLHPTQTSTRSIDSLPPNDVISTSNAASVPLSVAEQISVKSKRNKAVSGDIPLSAIHINDPTVTSQQVLNPPTAASKAEIKQQPSIDSAAATKHVDSDLLDRVKQIQIEIGEKAEKQDYRAQHLKKWDQDLQNKQHTLEKEQIETQQKNDDIQQQQVSIDKKEQVLLETEENLKWGNLKHKRNASDIEGKHQNLHIAEQKLNEAHSKQLVIEQKLIQKQQKLDAEHQELKQRDDEISNREQVMTEKEGYLKKSVVKLKELRTYYDEEIKEMLQKENDMMQEEKRLQTEQEQINKEIEALKKDKAQWMEKSAAFQQRDDELTTKEDQYLQDIQTLNRQKEQMKRDTAYIKKETDKNKNKADELELIQQKLKQREDTLLQRGNILKSEEETLQNQKKEFMDKYNLAKQEMQTKQNTYNLQIKQLQEDQQKLKEDQQTLAIEQRELKEQQVEYKQNKTQLEKEQKEVKEKLKFIEKEQSKIETSRTEIASKQTTLEYETQQLRRDEKILKQNQDTLQKEEKLLQNRKETVISQEQDINNRMVKLNTERNEHYNDKMKTQQIQNELNTQQKQLEIQSKQTEDKEREIAQRYMKMNNEEQEVMRKIEPIKQRTKELDELQESLEKRERTNAEQQYKIDMQQTQNIETQKQLIAEQKVLKDEHNRLEMEKKRLQTKHDKITLQDKRIVETYDEFNKEKYEIYKLDRNLASKQTEIEEREKTISIQQQNITDTQLKIDQETQEMVQRKEQMEKMEGDFNKKRQEFETEHNELQQNIDKYKADHTGLQKALQSYNLEKQQLEEKRFKIDSERNLIKEEKDYVKQQIQALNGQKTVLDGDKKKLESKSLLLASQMQQVNHEKQAQNVTKSQLEKINRDLKSAQQKHKEENEKLKQWNAELQNEQLRLNELKQTMDERTKTMERDSFALDQKEIELQKLSVSLEQQKIEIERYRIPQETWERLQALEEKAIIVEEKEKSLKREIQMQKEKAELVEIAKQQILLDQNDIKQKENKILEEQQKVSAALKDADDSKYALKIDIARKESVLATKEKTLIDRNITIANEERKVKNKITELQEIEDALTKKENELNTVQRDVNIKEEQMLREMQQRTNEIQTEREHVIREKNQLLEQQTAIELSLFQQKEMQNKYAEELQTKYNELQAQLQEMEANASQNTQKVEQLTKENVSLIKDKHLLQQTVIKKEKKDKVLKQQQMDLKIKQQQIEIENEKQKAKHLRSTLGRRQNIIESNENKITLKQQQWNEKHDKLLQQQRDLNQIMLNLEKQISLTEKVRNEAAEAEKTANEKTKMVTDLEQNLQQKQQILQQNDVMFHELQHKYHTLDSEHIQQKNLQQIIERVQHKSFLKDGLIHNLQNELTQVKSHLNASTKKLSVLDPPPPTTAGVALSEAQAASTISARNKEVLDMKYEPQSIGITDLNTCKSTIEAPITQSIPLISVPLQAPEPTAIVGQVIAQSIPLNDPLDVEPDTLKPAHSMTEDVAVTVDEIESIWMHPVHSKAPAAVSFMVRDEIATQYIASVPLSAAAPISQISRTNTPKLASYKQPQSIDINPAKAPSFGLLTAPQQRILKIEDEADDLPPKKGKHTKPKKGKPKKPTPPKKAKPQYKPYGDKATRTHSAPTEKIRTVEAFVELFDVAPKSVPLSVAQPTDAISKRNLPKTEYVPPSSIGINDPDITSETVIAAPQEAATSGLVYIATQDVASVPFSVAEPISVISRRNQPNSKYVTPSSIAINDAFATSQTVITAPAQVSSVVDSELLHPIDSKVIDTDSLPPTDIIPTANVPSVPLLAAQAKSVISKRNIPKPEYILPSAIAINDPQITSQHVIFTPTATKPDDILLHPTQTRLISVDSLPPNDVIATANVPSIAVSAAEPTSALSKRNAAKIKYVTPSSIDINDASITSKTVIASPQSIIVSPEVRHPIDSGIIASDSLPPKDSIPTANISSVPLAAAEQIAITSKRNIAQAEHILPSSISINDPQTTSEKVVSPPSSEITKPDLIIAHPIESGIVYKDSLPPNDVIPTAYIPSIALYAAQPTPVVSLRNVSISSDILPASIGINDVQITSQRVVAVPSQADTTSVTEPTSVPLCAAPAISHLSRHNQPKLEMYPLASSIPITSIIEATDNILYHPSNQSVVIDTTKLAQGIFNLKQLHDIQDKDESIETAQDAAVEVEIAQVADISELESELKSGLNAQDLDAVFQCSTNPDLLFDDVAHLETIYLGLDTELREYLSQCRDCKSITDPLPSNFQSITGLRGDDGVFSGDALCCVSWKLYNDNKQFETIVDDLKQWTMTCDQEIEANRELMEQYKSAMENDKTCSISNRNKLKKQISKQKNNKKSIHDIVENKSNLQFDNILSDELLQLQYKNSEWLLLRSTLNEWKTSIERAIDSDHAAFHGSDALYLRSFCVLPAQKKSVRKRMIKESHLETELQRRLWVKQLNSLLFKDTEETNSKCEIFFSEMGPNIASWEDKLLVRDLTSYLLNGSNFELHSTDSSLIPLSEGFVRIGYQAQLLIESAQSLLSAMDPFIERIITEAQNWSNRNDNVYGHKMEQASNLESSLKHGMDLVNIDALTLKDKTPLQRAKLLENDEKYISLFKDPLSCDLDELLHDINTRKIDQKYMKKLHKFLAQYFQILYRDKLMLPTPNSTIIEETACETWQKHALLEAVCSDSFGKILQLLSNESLGKQICHFTSHNVFDQNTSEESQQHKHNKKAEMFDQLFKPFETFQQYHSQNIKQKMYEIVSDFDIQQFLSDHVYQNALQHKLEHGTQQSGVNEWSEMSFADSLLAPQQFIRDEAIASASNPFPSFSSEEGLATHWTAYLKGVLNNVPIERPIRLPEHYHDIEFKTEEGVLDEGYLKHLKQHYYVDSYKPPSHEDVAPRISIEDRMNGVDIYRDKYIQRPHQSKRILQTQLRFLYHNKSDYMRGAFPLENFNYLPYGTKKPVKHRVTVRKSPFVQARAQENYETRIYTKVATNYKLTSNRTADMFNARGFDIIYDSTRVM